MREGFEAIRATKTIAGVILGHFNMTWFCYSCASQMRKCDRGTSILKNAKAKWQWYKLDISYVSPPSLPFWQNLNNWAAFRAHMFIHTGSWFIHHSSHPRKFCHSLLFVTLWHPERPWPLQYSIASLHADILKGSDMLYCCCLSCQEDKQQQDSCTALNNWGLSGLLNGTGKTPCCW